MTISAAATKPVLTLSEVSKRFGGVIAADKISLQLLGGQIFGLIGPNGSGKTTLLNLITGIYRVDSGRIELEGRDITKAATHARALSGVVRSFQHPRLLSRCDIETNLLVGQDLAGRRGLLKDKDRKAYLLQLLTEAGLQDTNLKSSTDKLSYGQQKLLEIVRALLAQPKVLLLDEPAAGLNRAEMQYIRGLMRLAVSEGIAVLLIEHAMDLVMEVCDVITVLNFGRQLATGTPTQVQENPQVIEAYLGGGKHDA